MSGPGGGPGDAAPGEGAPGGRGGAGGGSDAPPKPYWQGLYWDGFSPAAVGAVPLAEAELPDDRLATMMLRQTRHEVAGLPGDLAPADFFVTIIDVEEAGKTVVRCWHKNVFSGARDAAVADPGALNVDFHFRASDAELLGRKTWDETEAELARNEQQPAQ